MIKPKPGAPYNKTLFDDLDVTLCKHCNCMTHTKYEDNSCGKCGSIKS